MSTPTDADTRGNRDYGHDASRETFDPLAVAGHKCWGEIGLDVYKDQSNGWQLTAYFS